MDLLTTFIWVDDVPGAAAFYNQALGLATSVLEQNPGRGWRAELPTGRGGLSIADTVELAAALELPEFVGLDGPAPCAVQLTFVAEDITGAYQRCVASGATSLSPPTAMPWGQTIARVRAPHGVLISLVTPMGPRP